MKRFVASLAAAGMLMLPVPGHTAEGTAVSIGEVSRDGDILTIRGGSSFVDQPFLALGTDPAGDISPALAAKGMDVTGTSMATTLSGSVRVRWSVASLPPVVGGSPAVIYGRNFCVQNGDCYELDLGRVNANPPSADPYAFLWRCADPSCAPGDQSVAQSGGMPATFDAASGTVTVTLPGVIGAGPGRTISPVVLDANGSAFTMLGTLSPWTGTYDTGDGVAQVADYTVPRREISVAVGPPGADPAQVDYGTTVVPAADGSWTATLDVSGQTGELGVYARACFGSNNCGHGTAAGAPELVEPAFGDLSAPIRPGSQLGNYCSFNFIFHQEVYATAGEPAPVPEVYIGTAAHCTDGPGERVSVGGFGEIGTVVYDSDEVGSDVDFSLVRIDDHLVGQTNPQMRGFEGPTGVARPAELALGDVVDVYGYGIGVGQFEQTRPRSGVLTEWTQDEYMADMPAVNGDSGAPLLHDETGEALGIISRYGIRVPPSTDWGPLVDWALREIHAAGFGDVVLSTIGS